MKIINKQKILLKKYTKYILLTLMLNGINLFGMNNECDAPDYTLIKQEDITGINLSEILSEIECLINDRLLETLKTMTMEKKMCHDNDNILYNHNIRKIIHDFLNKEKNNPNNTSFITDVILNILNKDSSSIKKISRDDTTNNQINFLNYITLINKMYEIYILLIFPAIIKELSEKPGFTSKKIESSKISIQEEEIELIELKVILDNIKRCYKLINNALKEKNNNKKIKIINNNHEDKINTINDTFILFTNVFLEYSNKKFYIFDRENLCFVLQKVEYILKPEKR